MIIKNIIVRTASVVLLALGLHSSVLAGEHGTAEEATVLVKKAVAYLEANGKDKAFAEFSNPAGTFRDRDLYIFVIDMNGLELANGANSKIIGKNVLELKDADGNAMVKNLIALANGKGKGWVDYSWPNPMTHKVDRKSTYLEKSGDVLVASGIYK
ncbi:cache domain-containing protein [Massilia antarctica]|uniref:Cache domain-containing protein n=1 Tax=Massilia antarctica TaxID=2765360 RepID=A0AA48WAD4_9BURK|nr:cache domain-containing protein [Massilia antarctica]QPI47665.1 cache domain-containing protein [Massilia antarctica]